MVRIKAILHDDEYKAIIQISETERRDMTSQVSLLIHEALVSRGCFSVDSVAALQPSALAPIPEGVHPC